ncbi:O-methyltransferase [Serpentinicella alkaliphila]|uniref:tRNA 5-hydroxyuridine methyltransferase n=1 Tax=Serpentinicella alkaliphila TaxID=1734049 RepID=A0A4V2T391_9FIRM|nr:O-methyltransferase [Serpentinicella alkaliphila]QUH26678.1 O-methyltransferase [Serpentinicella alkaliphila]TCQ00524.1 putative O-methyltransferase YrrM [Serpentinicella alkaliphila]
MNYITQDYIESYIRSTLKDREGLMKDMEEYASENHVPIVQKEVAALIEVLTKAVNAKRVLEVGTAIAYSTSIFAFAMGKDGHVTTIERNENMIEVAKENIKKNNLENQIKIIQDDAQEVLKYLEGEFDIIFLDGAKGQYNDFLDNCLRLLKVGGIIISDNILFKGMVATDELVIRRKRTIVNRMRQYLDYICNHPHLDTTIIPIGDGVAISYKKREV